MKTELVADGEQQQEEQDRREQRLSHTEAARAHDVYPIVRATEAFVKPTDCLAAVDRADNQQPLVRKKRGRRRDGWAGADSAAQRRHI